MLDSMMEILFIIALGWFFQAAPQSLATDEVLIRQVLPDFAKQGLRLLQHDSDTKTDES
jgi:hypothetical protein